MNVSHINVSDNHTVICELRKGNDIYFEAVYRAYYKNLFLYASRYVSGSHATEIIQDTFMYIWENRGTLDPALSLRSFMFVIVKNKALDLISHNNIKERVHHKIADSWKNTLDDPDFYMENDLIDHLAIALEKLPVTYRDAVRMHRLEGFSYKEIAEIEGVSVPTINYRLVQAIKFLLKELKEFLPMLVLLCPLTWL